MNVMGSGPGPSYTFYQYVLITLYFITYLFSVWINSLWQWVELKNWLFCFEKNKFVAFVIIYVKPIAICSSSTSIVFIVGFQFCMFCKTKTLKLEFA